MRLVLLLTFAPFQALAWEFSPTPICTLSHKTDEAKLVITHDPAVPEYRLEINLNGDSWATSGTFGIAFQGGAKLTIGTNRHRTDGSTLSVADSGFGNVLDGLEFNGTATAFTESQTVAFSLAGAQQPVRDFRDCSESFRLS
ncbi:hypothetical protein [Aliiruegeria lutimaris]|uniref:Uncharacterized protein n=1 Tax=Aliiruegeria lutimaris TaxID=571298 RepID=A0A1G8WYH8_9RHOB|nr:hypothetical protein [Aliiruegeria lutimaris]SDJ83136.1 hypothetical protein SAMN04488026_102511 [Aliiruegeria lutimaris]